MTISLQQPITIKHLTLPTRLVMPPMATAKADEHGQITPEILSYYDEKTKSGNIGLVIIEHAYITRQGRASSRQLSISTDSDIDGLSKLSEIIHRNGSGCVMQISHAGNAARDLGMATVGPSRMTHPSTNLTCEELTTKQIQTIIAEFAAAARRVKQAGFDGVEIHGAHGYLLSQFYSPKTNQRTDEYGKTLENRLRIHREIVRAVKAEAGDDFLVMLRLGACDYAISGGATIEDSIYAARILEQEGIDIIDITGGLRGYINPSSTEPGWFKDASKPIKQAISIPVILTGGITTVNQANALLQEGCADMIGVGRAILQDSSWPYQLSK